MTGASPFPRDFLQVFIVIPYPCAVVTCDTTDEVLLIEQPQASQIVFYFLPATHSNSCALLHSLLQFDYVVD